MRNFLAVIVAGLGLVQWLVLWYAHHTMLLGLSPWSQRRLDYLKVRAVFATATAVGFILVLTLF
jgi:hypothetical protein